jgi:hypothetical protein
LELKKKQDEQHLTSAEMKVVRKTAGYSLLDHKRSELITELKTTPITEYLQQYRINWLQHINLVEHSRLPTQMLHCVPTERRFRGRLLKRCQETVTGPRPNIGKDHKHLSGSIIVTHVKCFNS